MRRDDSTEAAWWFEADETDPVGGQRIIPAPLGDDEDGDGLADIRGAAVGRCDEGAPCLLRRGMNRPLQRRRQINPNAELTGHAFWRRRQRGKPTGGATENLGDGRMRGPGSSGV